MSSLTSSINVNVDSQVKEEAISLFNSLGLNMSTAINIFLRKALAEGGIPFEVKTPKPNKEFLEALQDGEDILDGKIEAKTYNSVKELIGDLENGV